MAKVYYNQMDSRWSNHSYPAPGYENATVGSSGCGPTCGAMIVSSSKETIHPDAMCDISKENGFRVSGGTSDGLFEYIAQRWGIEMKVLHSSFEAHEYAKNGYFVVIACAEGLWTTGGHFILAVGTRENEIEIYDPYLYAGKFDRYGREGKVRVEGVSCFVDINIFKENSNAQRFYAFKVNSPSPEPTLSGDLNKHMIVNTNSLPLNVRETPAGNIIGSLSKGTEVIVHEEQNGWSRIDQGWVSSTYLANVTPTPAPSGYVLGRYHVNTPAGLNVRSGPNTNYAIRKIYKNSTVFDTFEISRNWARTPSGWVCLDYCKLMYAY